MKNNKSFIFGISGLGLLLFLIIFGPYLPGIDEHLTTRSYFHSFFNLPPYHPSRDFILGSDRKGRDVLSVLILGTKTTLLTGAGLSAAVFALAIPLGISSAHFPYIKVLLQGWNYLFSRIPLIFFFMFIVTIPFFIFSQHRPVWMFIILVVLETGKIAEVIEKNIQSIHQTTYYEAAMVSGTGMKGLFKWYYWPICLPQWLSSFFTHIGNMLFLIGQLGIFNIFLSQKFIQLPGGPGPTFYGVVNTANLWPVYLTNIINDIKVAPWIPICASCFIIFSMLSFFALGEGIRQLERQSRESSSLPRRRAQRLFKLQSLLGKERKKETNL
ncbi:peptide/nickel transport system permease protein [Bacillus sp. OV322]|uniref:ABC transporter permease subunit n=1 Tax=Bacillus sp. OV322 TaxID=1882764 RepID=UPI0008E9ACF8|nr:ABC transporter permease subunit [Bacillus sp. OV322]SFC27154.1 peptide/nickel transport system permease protein [Bacillus sp. OV322]